MKNNELKLRTMKLKKVLFWVLAVMISLAAMFYQRMTGPTYPKKYELSYQNEKFQFDLPRSRVKSGLISKNVDRAT